MRKVLLFTLTASVILIAAGCLKDKGFEDHKYGTQITEVKGVAFPQATSSPLVIGINSQATSQTVDGPFLTLEQEGAAASDVKITLTLMTAAMLYDVDTSLVPLNLTQVSVNSMVVTVHAGEKFSDALKITVTNSSLLDATKSYAIGFTISAVDQGYTIASNMKNVVVAFNIKNKYDGKYHLRGIHNRAPYNQYPFDIDLEMRTSGPSSVAMWLPAPFSDYGQPIGTGPGVVGWYGNAVSPNFNFDPTTNLCTGVSLYVGAAVTVAMVTTGGIVNEYKPATKTMYLTFQYNGNDLRRFYDTLTYIGPR